MGGDIVRITMIGSVLTQMIDQAFHALNPQELLFGYKQIASYSLVNLKTVPILTR